MRIFDQLNIRGTPMMISHTGNTYWVDENAHRNGPGTKERPAVSINAALDLCVANRGDVILVKPGHIENYTADADLALDIAGVAVIGLGTGTNQAKMSFDAEVAQTVTAANISIINFWLYAGAADVDSVFTVSSAGDYFTIQGCRIHDASTSLDFEELVHLDTGANNFAFVDNLVRTLGGEAVVATGGVCKDLTVKNNLMVCESTVAIFDFSNTGALTGTARIEGNTTFNKNAVDLSYEIKTDAVCVFLNNNVAQLSTNLMEGLDGSDVSYCFRNNEVDVAAVGSVPMGSAATAWA